MRVLACDFGLRCIVYGDHILVEQLVQMRRAIVGTVTYDNALAEMIIDLLKTEVINRLGPWKSKDEVE